MPFCACPVRTRKRNGVWTCSKTRAYSCSLDSSTILNPKRSWCSACSPRPKRSTKAYGGSYSACNGETRLQSGPALALLLANDVGRVLARIHRNVEPPDHHLFPRLIAPADFLLRIGIVAVVGRVVEVRRALDLRPLGQHNRIGEIVEQLPVEIVLGHTQHDLRFARGIDQAVFEILAAIVHVRHQVDQPGGSLQSNAG